MRSTDRSTDDGGQEGSIIIIVMMFMLVFLIIGSALFVLVRSSNGSTELERKDVKAFNVAEAGVDAAMVELRLRWPRFSTDAKVTVDQAEFRSLYSTTEFRDPTSGQFIQAVTYDNTPDNPTVYTDKRLDYDSNHDDIM